MEIGWKSARGNLRETFEVMDTIYSIDDMENGIMKEIFDLALMIGSVLANFMTMFYIYNC